jgi:pyrophosphate--fructose-6-phosphate 1-phosphotransferase
MSCIGNLSNKNPQKWTAAGCPLPSMIGMERRQGKNKPVIKKALVNLNGEMFKAYESVRELWSVLDAYRSPGPIQYVGPGSDEVCFMVQPPKIEFLVSQAKRF